MSVSHYGHDYTDLLLTLLLQEFQDALRRAHCTSAGPDEIHYQLLKHVKKTYVA